MNTKHTPGTWLIDGMHIIGNGYSIAHINSHRTTEGRANASLIAAAPELLEALETAQMALIGYTHQNDITRNAMVKICAAIAKAKVGA